jgi:hypothetical protein
MCTLSIDRFMRRFDMAASVKVSERKGTRRAHETRCVRVKAKPMDLDKGRGQSVARSVSRPSVQG